MPRPKNSSRTASNEPLDPINRSESAARLPQAPHRSGIEIVEAGVAPGTKSGERPKGSVKKSRNERPPAPVIKLVTERVVAQEAIVKVLEEWLVLAREGRVNELAVAGSLDGTVTVEWEAGDRFLLLGALELCKTRILREITDEDEDEYDE